MKTSVPGKYIVETVRDVQYDSYYGSHPELSGRRFFGFRFGPFRLLIVFSNPNFPALATVTMVPPRA